MTKDPIEAMEKCLNSVIEGIQVDYDNEEVAIKTNKGTIWFNGDGLEMTVDLDEYKQ